MEGVTFSLRDCVDILREMGLQINEMRACGGGGSSPFWRQMLADVFGCEIQAMVSKEGPALGVAILAGVGAGVYKSVEEACGAIIQTNNPEQPIKNNSYQYENYYAIYKKLYPSLKDNFKQLSRL